MVVDGSEFLMLVGLGASAGGVEALMSFFERMPADAGMAYVVILHISPEHESHLPEVLRARTLMPVLQVNEPVRVEPNRVYVVPPDRDLYMSDGHIQLAERGQDGRAAPIDLFFRTLADSYRERGIAVVLSGAGTDGSVGVRRVKEMGGVVIAQEPSEAEHAAMPRGAMETGAVDFVLPLAAIPEKLTSLRRNAERIQLPASDEPPPDEDEDALREVLALLRLRTRHDFNGYKRSTLLRRVERRMQVTQTADLPAYLAHVREQPEELLGLLSDLLISVTNFFRDRDAFAQLEGEVVPLLFAGKGAGDQVRVWVAGCATGEEAYSLAMLLCEQAEQMSSAPTAQVFASDIDEVALQQAREGVYPEAVEADISPERLKRFFVKEGQYYRVKRELRERVLFTPHNVLRDPPFSKLDLVSCRNLLIYVNRQTQERVLEVFHFALRPGGYLFLGSSETAEALPDLFTPLDKKHRVFRRLDVGMAFRGMPTLPLAGRWEARLTLPPRTGGQGTEPSSYGELHFRALEAFSPPSVLVNADYEIVHLSDNVGRYLRFSGGEPTRNLLKVAHPELKIDLRSLLLRVEQGGGSSRDVTANFDGRRKVIRMSVRPVNSPRTAPGFCLVVFEELPESALTALPSTPGGISATTPALEADAGLEPVVQRLEDDLQNVREQLRATVEMYETQAEEFKAANEELQAMNEELRSASEEMETSKEELQSVNEELTTVNNELKEKVEEVGRTNSDLQNLLAATQIATFFLDRSLRIKRYTPGVQELFNLIPGDVGRPLAHLTHKLDYAGLIEDAETVLRTLQTVEREAATHEGRSYLIRLLPYRTPEDRIDGVVITFIDITERKRAEDALRESEERLRGLNEGLEERVRGRTEELAETNVSLQEEVQIRTEAEVRVKQLLRKLISVQEEERRRIARELHDTLGQQLAALRLSIDMFKSESEGRVRLLEHIGRAQAIFERLNADVDFLAWELRPATLDQLGLDAALRTFIREWSEQFGVEADYRGFDDGVPRLAPEVETNLYRILQEALQNVHKHAGATRVSVILEQNDGHAVLIVEDNGKGYDADGEAAAVADKGMGLTNMRERTALLGGDLEVESAPGAGTTIYVRVPVGGQE
ncbi:MAG: PAS domain-containing protein [Acidobacteria bacterium]|nr:PAS domain-containing protein [Acidobacteriota bacterium]